MDHHKDIIEINARLKSAEATLGEHHKDLNGNGKPGVKCDVADLKKDVAVINTKIALYSVLGSAIGSGVMAILLKRIGG
ncbi:MAG: hypothetical protein WCS77_00110 [Elusimicrobiaceae bacterium]|jgi:hypothetical protein